MAPRETPDHVVNPDSQSPVDLERTVCLACLAETDKRERWVCLVLEVFLATPNSARLVAMGTRVCPEIVANPVVPVNPASLDSLVRRVTVVALANFADQERKERRALEVATAFRDRRACAVCLVFAARPERMEKTVCQA